jgi:transposase-like protein
MRMPTLASLQPLFDNENEAISFLFQHSAFYKERLCPNCGTNMKPNLEQKTFRCYKRTCNHKVSLMKNSLFQQHRIPCSKILQMAYFWLSGMKSNTAVILTGHSKNTIASYYGMFRQLVSDSLDEEDFQIGGEGVVVEIDETKMGKRKYNRGHRVEGVWVVGGVERTAERRVFLVTVENRNAETMRDVISRHVREGSIIYTDMWRGYNGISDGGEYQHHTVNHSIHFRDPQTGVHTNSIEGTWNGLKIKVPVRSRNEGRVEGHLFEFIWRRQQKYNLWIGFLNALRKVHYE